MIDLMPDRIREVWRQAMTHDRVVDPARIVMGRDSRHWCDMLGVGALLAIAFVCAAIFAVIMRVVIHG